MGLPGLFLLTDFQDRQFRPAQKTEREYRCSQSPVGVKRDGSHFVQPDGIFLGQRRGEERADERKANLSPVTVA
jgi:hypothetical protein